ncbi:MAG: phosphoribosylformylglycinamidine cyclo-ligase [Spirochaetes bacterium]|nr:phosphoribosylformylglycinamidine cyclo-ligase [Spirochaetota bacterium]
MSLTYKRSGVDITLAGRSLKSVKRSIGTTFNKNVLTPIGKFGGFFQISKDKVLVSSIDGVGTKIKLAALADDYDVIGQDIVNHGVNDIAVHNATPLFFLDYIAMEKLNPKALKQIIQGMIKACRQNNVALIGGETAEMPGIYRTGMYDVAGCMVGIVDKDRVIDGKTIKAGDRVYGVASNGLHTNGFSMVNRLFFQIKKYKIDQYIPFLKSTLKKALLRPHLSYLKLIKHLTKRTGIKGFAHITGGGIIDNTVRILPDGLKAVIHKIKIKRIPVIFPFIQKEGSIKEEEMYKTFNMGVGLIIVADKNYIPHSYPGYSLFPLGDIQQSSGKARVRLI